MIASSGDRAGAFSGPVRLRGPVDSLHIFMCEKGPHSYVPALSGVPLPDCFHRVCANDLRDAQRQSAALRTAAGSSGCTIFLDVDATVHRDVRVALSAAAGVASGEPALRYVGTPRGLAGFIDDLHRLGIADGVTLRPQRLAPCPEDSINEMLQALIG